MAVKPSNAALAALRNTRRAKQEELGRAYEAMGGSNTALVSNSQFAPNTIPSLKRNIENTYAAAQNASGNVLDRDSQAYANLQAMSGAYNDYANSRTSDKLKHVKSESYAQLVSQPTIMGMSNPMYGNLTQDMKDAGLTLEDLERYNKAKSRQTYEDVASQIGADHPILATGLAAAEQPIMSLGNVAKNVKNYALGNPIENNFNPATALRQSVAENNIDTKVGNFAYGVGNSMADMLIASLAGGNVGPGIMGLEKADEVMNNAVDRGLTPNQIMAEGVGSAITTALTERIPFKEFKAGNNIGRAMVSEGLQEGSEDIADTIVDILVTTVGGNPEKSEIARQYQAYLNMGMSEEDASKATVIDYLKQVGLDSVAGAIAGGGMGGINNVSQGYNFFRGNTNTETNVDENVKADTEQTIPTLRDSRAEEANIQARREEELAQLTEAVAQMREQQNAQQPIPQVVRANPEDVIYHAGILSRLNKAETNGRFSGSNRGTGYFGTGHYFVDNNTLNELEHSGYKDKPLSSVDISGYTNLFRADTDAKANSLHNFLSDMTKFTQGSDKVSIEELYEEYTKAFDGEGNVMPYEDFVNRINGLTEYMKNSDMYDRGDSVSTQFMKSLGYGGVDTRGTRYADTRYGTVIYDLDENSVLQSNIPALQRASTDMLTRNENRNVFDAEEDARIQKILDDQAKKAKVNARLNEIYDNTELEQNEKKLEDLYKQRDDVQNVIYNINEALKDVDAYVRETEDFIRQFGLEGPTEEEHAEKVKETTADYTLSLESRQTELESINNQIADLEARNDTLYEEYQKAYKQAEEEINAAQTNQVQDENAGLDEDIQNLSTVEEATAALNEEISALNNEVGNYPMNIEYFSRNERGEVESEDSERVQTGRYKTSKAYTNTAERSGNLTDEQRRMVEQNGSMLYQENSWKESTQEAEKRIIEGGWQGEFEKLTAKDANSFNNVDVDEMFMLWRHYKEQAVALDRKGLDSKSTWQKTVDCLTQLKAAGSHAGSELNAFKKWSMNNTPEGLLTEAEVIIDEYINGLNEGAKNLAKKNKWFAQIAKETKGKTRQMDVAFIKQFLTEAEKLAPTHTVQEGETLANIAKAYNTTVDALIELNGKDIKPGDTITVSRLDPDSNEARVIMANLGKMVNTQIPVSLREKITTLLMDNMLGNFRTLITRNFGGNVGYNLIEQNITKNIAAKIDKALSEKRGTARTISENTKEGRQAYKEGFKEAFKQECFDLTNNLRTARSGENNLRTAVANNRQIFSDKNIFGKVGNMYDRLVRSGLSVGDRPFYEGVYRQYMVEYKKMFDQGLLKDMSEEEFNKTAQALAQIKALEAVYQDDSEMAQAFMAAKNMVSLASKAVTGVDIMSQFTMPFVKTPANIAQRAIEYSPVGLIKNAVKTIRELRHTMTANGQMDFDQQRFATDTARNLVGSVMWGIALYMASAGILTGAYDDDEDMRAAQKEAGMQEYALHLPINGGMDIDVSSMPVIGNDLVAAAASYDAFKNNPELSVLQRIGKGFSAGIEKQFESSALQGLQRLFGANSSYGYGGQGSNGSIMEQAKDTIKAGASQLIPSLLRQLSTAADPYQRRLTGLNADDYYINNLRSAIPWLRQDLQPKIGRTGEVLEQNHSQTVAGRWFNNFINPFNVTYGTEDAVRDEAMRLYESTGNNVAFQPYVSMKELKTDDHIPTDEEFTQYQQNAYGAMNQIATQVINSDYYQNLTDGDKESLLAKLYQAVKSVEKANILGSDKSNLSGEAKAYDEGGAEGLINYLTAQSALSSLGVTNNEDNRNAVLASLNANGGDLSAIAEQYDNSVARAGTDLDLLMNNQYSGLIETIGTWDSDAQRELREEINSIINGVEFNSMVGIDKDYDGAKKAYDEGGVNGLAEYLFPATVLKNNGMTNNEKNREMILNAYNEGGANAVQQIIQASQALGNDSNLTYKYEHATSYIPSLTPSQFQTTWNTINTDGNTSIKIDELIDYLNRDPDAYTSETALQYWNAFYTGTSEKIPVLVNGQWQAKNA